MPDEPLKSTKPALFRRVDVGDGAVMFVPVPDPPDGAETLDWQLRYGDADEYRMQAATLISSFEYLLSPAITAGEAARRLKMMRAAYRSQP